MFYDRLYVPSFVEISQKMMDQFGYNKQKMVESTQLFTLN